VTTRTPRRTWVEDESRCEIALWFGDFESERDLRRYVKRFRRELRLPAWDNLNLFYLKTCFSPQRGDLRGLIGKLLCSESFLEPVEEAVSSLDIASYNGAIALSDLFTDDDFTGDASSAAFIGLFPYDVYSDALISSMPYMNDEKVSVWFGTFASRTEFETYLHLPDHVPPEKGEDQNGFAVDFRIAYYVKDFAAYNLSRGMRPRPFASLLAPIPMPQELRESMIRAVIEQRISDGNAIYVAFDLDYDNVKSGLKRVARSRHDFHYVGTFDNPRPPGTAKRKY
jgi:hypothetical protein